MNGVERVTVAVVGAGPVGVTAANLLGLYGVDTLIVDRDTEIVQYPRAIGVDDETLRTLQGIGLAVPLLGAVIQNVPLKLIDAAGRCLADIRPTVRELGWHRLKMTWPGIRIARPGQPDAGLRLPFSRPAIAELSRRFLSLFHSNQFLCAAIQDELRRIYWQT